MKKPQNGNNCKKKEKMHVICKTTQKESKDTLKSPPIKVKKPSKLQTKFTKKAKAGEKSQKCKESTKNAQESTMMKKNVP